MADAILIEGEMIFALFAFREVVPAAAADAGTIDEFVCF